MYDKIRSAPVMAGWLGGGYPVVIKDAKQIWCPFTRNKLFCLWDKCEFVFTRPKDKHLDICTFFWTSNITHCFFQFFPTCPKDK